MKAKKTLKRVPSFDDIQKLKRKNLLNKYGKKST